MAMKEKAVNEELEVQKVINTLASNGQSALKAFADFDQEKNRLYRPCDGASWS